MQTEYEIIGLKDDPIKKDIQNLATISTNEWYFLSQFIEWKEEVTVFTSFRKNVRDIWDIKT